MSIGQESPIQLDPTRNVQLWFQMPLLPGRTTVSGRQQHNVEASRSGESTGENPTKEWRRDSQTAPSACNAVALLTRSRGRHLLDRPLMRNHWDESVEIGVLRGKTQRNSVDREGRNSQLLPRYDEMTPAGPFGLLGPELLTCCYSRSRTINNRSNFDEEQLWTIAPR